MKYRLTLGAISIIMAYSCGKLAPETNINVRAEGETTVRHQLDVKFSVCDVYEDPAHKIDCVNALLEILLEQSKQGDGDGDDG